jgi:hypothetical protein
VVFWRTRGYFGDGILRGRSLLVSLLLLPLPDYPYRSKYTEGRSLILSLIFPLRNLIHSFLTVRRET